MVEVTMTSHKDEILVLFEKAQKNALTAVGMTAEAHAKDLITEQKAVDTGRLRNSITYAVVDTPPTHIYTDNIGNTYPENIGGGVKPNEVYIGTNVEYAAYIELGTSRMSPRPYLRPAAMNYTEEYKAIIKAALESV